MATDGPETQTEGKLSGVRDWSAFTMNRLREGMLMAVNRKESQERRLALVTR